MGGSVQDDEAVTKRASPGGVISAEFGVGVMEGVGARALAEVAYEVPRVSNGFSRGSCMVFPHRRDFPFAHLEVGG